MRLHDDAQVSRLLPGDATLPSRPALTDPILAGSGQSTWFVIDHAFPGIVARDQRQDYTSRLCTHSHTVLTVAARRTRQVTRRSLEQELPCTPALKYGNDLAKGRTWNFSTANRLPRRRTTPTTPGSQPPSLNYVPRRNTARVASRLEWMVSSARRAPEREALAAAARGARCESRRRTGCERVVSSRSFHTRGGGGGNGSRRGAGCEESRSAGPRGSNQWNAPAPLSTAVAQTGGHGRSIRWCRRGMAAVASVGQWCGLRPLRISHSARRRPTGTSRERRTAADEMPRDGAHVHEQRLAT